MWLSRCLGDLCSLWHSYVRRGTLLRLRDGHLGRGTLLRLRDGHLGRGTLLRLRDGHLGRGTLLRLRDGHLGRGTLLRLRDDHLGRRMLSGLGSGDLWGKGIWRGFLVRRIFGLRSSSRRRVIRGKGLRVSRLCRPAGSGLDLRSLIASARCPGEDGLV